VLEIKVYFISGKSSFLTFLSQEIIMARITVEDCLKNVNNRFELIHMAAKRVRQLRKGADPTIVSKNRDVVVALREIAAGNVGKTEEVEQAFLIENHGDIIPEEPETETDENVPDVEKVDGDDA